MVDLFTRICERMGPISDSGSPALSMIVASDCKHHLAMFSHPYAHPHTRYGTTFIAESLPAGVG